jgi:hypothetical protein
VILKLTLIAIFEALLALPLYGIFSSDPKRDAIWFLAVTFVAACFLAPWAVAVWVLMSGAAA